MQYDREIDNEMLIHFIILYTLFNVDHPVEYSDLLNIILENCNINFNDFRIALENLVKTEHANTFLKSEHVRVYEITQKGAYLAKDLRDNVPIYIREPIKEAIKELYLEERRRNAVQARIIPIHTNEFAAECKLFDDEKTQIFELMLYAGGWEEAHKMVKYFKKNYETVYGEVLKIMDNANKEAAKEEEEKPEE